MICLIQSEKSFSSVICRTTVDEDTGSNTSGTDLARVQMASWGISISCQKFAIALLLNAAVAGFANGVLSHSKYAVLVKTIRVCYPEKHPYNLTRTLA